MKMLIAAIMTAVFALLCFNSVSSNPGVEVPWVVDCVDLNPYNGWMDEFGNCIPGVLEESTWRTRSPSTFYGLGDTYAPGIMERIFARTNPWEGYKGGIALMNCGDLGRKAWLKLPGRNWDGPYLVVDCSNPKHLYKNAYVYGLVVEWGWDTTVRWGGIMASEGVVVHLDNKPAANTGRGWYYRTWWERHALRWEVIDYNALLVYTGFRNLSLIPFP